MNIYTLKKQFEQMLHPAPSYTLIGAEPAWEYFTTAIKSGLDKSYCEELGFSMGMASHSEGNNGHTDENLFQVYFGRLIDAEEKSAWRTAEINFYYRYEMNANLGWLLSEHPQEDIETAFCSREDEDGVRRKIETVCVFAKERRAIWDEIRELNPVQSNYHFWIQ